MSFASDCDAVPALAGASKRGLLSRLDPCSKKSPAKTADFVM